MLALLANGEALVPSGVIWLLIIAVAIDAVLYLAYESIYRLWARDAERSETR
jgi:hypothetical protein